MTNPFSISGYSSRIFSSREADFLSLAKEAYRHQLLLNPVFRQYALSVLHTDSVPTDMGGFPYLPISFFKTHEVLSVDKRPSLFFESSGTTGQQRSRHFVADPALYRRSFRLGYGEVFGTNSDRQIFALLPGYLEQPHSSLVYMVNDLIAKHGGGAESFFLRDHERLYSCLRSAETEGRATLLIGVTHALLDLAEAFPMPLRHTIVMETGGMKGRRKELTRDEVHDLLKRQWSLPSVYSEYGMTELMSQAYAVENGLFRCPPWMKVLVREEDDPLTIRNTGRGALNIIDLANIHSCCFIATEDVGEVYEDGSFRVLGRMDQSEWRGCSLMAV